MPTGYRGIILALVGLALAGAAPQPRGEDNPEQKSRQGQPANTSEPIPIAISSPVHVIQPEVNAPPCGPNQYQAKDDLCAQWKAADAASDAACWAMLGTIVAAIGTFGLYWQIKLTRDAVQDTGKATKAMERQNELVAESQRPWLSFLPELNMVTAGSGQAPRPGIHLVLTVKNHTDFPAHDVRAAGEGSFNYFGLGAYLNATRQDWNAVIERLGAPPPAQEGRAIFPNDDIRIPVCIPLNPGQENSFGTPPTSVLAAVGVAYTFKGGVGITMMEIRFDNIANALEIDTNGAEILQDGKLRADITHMMPVMASVRAT